ncbi:MAG: alpha/beta fold hydrolase [Thermodesulfobacteriota bacterium]
MPDHKIDLHGGNHSVLLIHGLTGSPFEMKYLARKLNKAGFTVKGPCLEGHCTTLEKLSKTHWKDWYQSVRENFTEMKKSYDTVSIVGLCMGALLSLHLAYEFGSEVAAVSLISTTLFYDGWSLPWFKFLLPITYYAPFRYVYSYSETEPYGIKNKALRERIINLMQNDSIAYTKTPARSMHELFKLIREVKRELPAITTPALILHSREDDLTSTKNPNYVQNKIGSKIVRKVILDDSYHMMTIDNQKDRVAEETIVFFTEQILPAVQTARVDERNSPDSKVD